MDIEDLIDIENEVAMDIVNELLMDAENEVIEYSRTCMVHYKPHEKLILHRGLSSHVFRHGFILKHFESTRNIFGFYWRVLLQITDRITTRNLHEIEKICHNMCTPGRPGSVSHYCNNSRGFITLELPMRCELFNKTINSIKKIIILLKLLNLLNDYWNKRDINKKFCYVIFVTRRFKTNVLYHILKDIKDTNDKFNLLEPDYIVGYSNNPYKNSTESMCIAKSNKETLIRFR
ncbi:hypothetical protein HCN44_009071 [Aphidius gifuensis]|uniref:Uncharacterized protein n=1 Tax=Aphidius gifuensis TaxID=684658 RepID=A0A835CW57_APHGI|nr:hypothetical protein HCN44_009071 [Aphidius gifuensis]